MMLKLLGGFLVVFGCGCFGLAMCASHKRTEHELLQFVQALQWMEWELSCRLTPLPELCRGAADAVSEPVRALFLQLADELETHSEPDAHLCARKVTENSKNITPELQEQFASLGATLGYFDLEGQQKGLNHVRKQSQSRLDALTHNRSQRLRNYQTLGLCAGAALAILFL